MAVLIITIILLSILAIFFAVQFYNLIFRGFAPFISSQPHVIKAILEVLELKDGAIVYELGCGVAGFLRAVEENCPSAKLVGIEYSLLPFALARMQKALSKSKIVLRRENIFTVDLREANVIYCYLNDTMMKKLREKFEQECQPGTLIISYMFSVPGWQPERKLKIAGRKNERIYFYEI